MINTNPRQTALQMRKKILGDESRLLKTRINHLESKRKAIRQEINQINNTLKKDGTN